TDYLPIEGWMGAYCRWICPFDSRQLSAFEGRETSKYPLSRDSIPPISPPLQHCSFVFRLANTVAQSAVSLHPFPFHCNSYTNLIRLCRETWRIQSTVVYIDQ